MYLKHDIIWWYIDTWYNTFNSCFIHIFHDNFNGTETSMRLSPSASEAGLKDLGLLDRLHESNKDW